jgi:hypothetical protein
MDKASEKWMNDGPTDATEERRSNRAKRKVDRISGATKEAKDTAKATKATKKEEYGNMTYAEKKAVGGSSYYKG